ncbi:VapE domain-containing protein [Altererythrobacter sp. TH136]|uniref:VapE domain-containing protein n=1 Tax=Altererythrobacter sp. TH136 TaxID=2067415 RepID=UPI001164E7FB|nr:VapE domain-containing protein [Altererythrobacter sp. TH136]QDM40812.1 hypothetical protein C0V74_07045 [Altererythrobacter sp. TH136]
MSHRYGAGLEQWHHWTNTLPLAEHVLPVVVDPAVPISPDSNMKALGKTPSQINFRGEASGFAKWTDHRSTMKQIGKWELDERLGICMQSRDGGLRAFDIDVHGPKRSAKIVAAIEGRFPHLKFYRRSREGTGKVLLPFRLEGLLTKRVLTVNGGIIEILGDGQQWIADGAYIKDGKVDGRYLWPAGRPPTIDDVPLLTMAELDDLCALLEMLFAEGEDGWSIARERRQGTGEYTGPPRDDEIGAWLVQHWEITGDKGDGTLFVRCPWVDGHSSDSGPSETQYAPPDERFEKGHFKCLHASCQNRTDADFLEAMGFAHDMSDAPDLPAEIETAKGKEIEPAKPRYMLSKQQLKENRAYNHRLFLQDVESSGIEISWDDYTAQLVWRSKRSNSLAWLPFKDEQYQMIVEKMDSHGFVPQTAAAIRSAVNAHGVRHRVDTLIDWVGELPAWDGLPRIERFWHTYAKAADNAFTRAVGLYSWTAQAGRALAPGCQADMALILVGGQGVRKTSLVRSIAPGVKHFAEIDLTDRDDDTTRKMRGKAVAELGELRGLRGRDQDSTKAFVTRREEEWVPKYKEFPDTFQRRFIFYGTTNEDTFLADATGERRWLPFEVGAALDVEGVERDRDQLWAEAVALWRKNGIMWQEAERLAIGEHSKFKDMDPWLPTIARWLLNGDELAIAPVDRPYTWGTEDVLVGALGFKTSQLDQRLKTRAGKALKVLYCTHKKVRALGGSQGYIAYRDKIEAFLGEGEDDLFG